MAALMRWFHDKLGLAYHQMCIGEAPPSWPPLPDVLHEQPEGKTVTTEA